MVAIKYLLPRKTDGLKRRFKREAQILCSLSHPNIVDIYSFGFDGSAVYLVEELLTGSSLDRGFASKERMTHDEVIRVGVEAANALVYAHDEGVIHRDIKPANIFICNDGTLKLIDFGLARGEAFDTVLTETGCIAGTPLYLAPEQLEGMSNKSSVDIYSLGLVLYEGFCGKVPFEECSLSVLFNKKMSQSPPPLSSVVPDAPAEVCQMVDRMLDFDAEKRPSAKEVEEGLKVLVKKEPVSITELVQPVDGNSKKAVVNDSKKPSYLLLLPLLLFLFFLFWPREKTFELEMDVSERAVSALTIDLRSSRVADAEVDVIDSKTRELFGSYVMPGRGKQWKKELDCLPADREVKIIVRAKSGKRTVHQTSLVTRTKEVAPQLITEWKPFGLNEGPARHGKLCCIAAGTFGLRTFDLLTGKVFWQLPDKKEIIAICSNDEQLIITYKSGLVEARKWSDGELSWKLSYSTKPDDPAVWKDRVIFKAPNGVFHCLDMQSGKILWKLERFVRGNFKIIDDKVIICTNLGGVVSVDVINGKPNYWKLIFGRMTADPCSVSGLICLPGHTPSGTSYLFITRQQELIHKVQFDDRISEIVADEKRLYAFCSEINEFSVLDPVTGSILWKKETQDDFAGYQVQDGYVYLTDNSGIRCLKASHGKLLWQIKTKLAKEFPAQICDNNLIWWTSDGKMWKLPL